MATATFQRVEVDDFPLWQLLPVFEKRQKNPLPEVGDFSISEMPAFLLKIGYLKILPSGVGATKRKRPFAG
jgi:hypothetical protein